MVQLRSSRFLSCFYCGKRTTIKKDGLTQNFTCPKCDAENYLDENGEITDPPVATTASSRHDRFTSSNPDPFTAASPAEASIFCATCLKNQRLFTASIAQYEQPAHLDVRAADKHYFSYRRQMESTYPQVCSDCSSAVDRKIREARYQAQTDHLRRMRDQTRQNDSGARGYDILHMLSRLGLWIWWGGWAAQGLWHIMQLTRMVETGGDDGLSDPDDGSWIKVVTEVISKSLRLVPAGQVLRASMWLAWVGIWWNPRFVQANRGFTRHLSGFGQWYAFQALIAILRTFLGSFLELQHLSRVGGSEQQAVLAGHVGAILLSLLICRLALTSITVDTRPIFGTGSEVVSSLPSSAGATPNKTTATPTGFAAALHQALGEPSSAVPPSPTYEPKRDAFGNAVNPSVSRPTPSSTFLAPEAPPEEYADATDDMDWQPTVSQHRAFQTSTAFPSQQPRAFGESPTTSDSSPFWYKAPAAPLHLNHRLRNPPNVHFVTQSSSQRSVSRDNAQENNSVAFRGMKGTFGINVEQGSPKKEGLAPPRFFAKDRGGEEADGLADLLGSKFGLGDGSPARNGRDQPRRGGVFEAASQHGDHPQTNHGRRTTGLLGVGVFAVLWLAWTSITTMASPGTSPSQAKVAILGLATLWGVWCVGQKYRSVALAGPLSLVSMLINFVEIAAAGWVLLRLTQEQEDWEGWAGGVLCVMLGHQILESSV